MDGRDVRRCECQGCGCKTILAADNRSKRCSPCTRHGLHAEAPDLPDSFWQHPSMQEAREGRNMGEVSKAYRHHPRMLSADDKPLQQAAMATWVQLTQVQVCRIETGKSGVRQLDRLIHWATALKMPRWYVWFEMPNASGVSAPEPVRATVKSEEVKRKEADVKRRDALSIPLAVGGALLADASQADLWERMAHAVSHPERMDDQSAMVLERETSEFYRREEFVAARVLAPKIQIHAVRLADILQGGPPGPIEKRMLTAIGEALALKGWFSFDTGNSRAALKAWELAEDAAKDANDGPLTACIYAYRSYLAESEGELGKALDLLVSAQNFTHGIASATTRSWLAAREGEVRALLNDAVGANRAVERAVTVYDYARPDQERPWTGFFTPSRLGSMVVTTYVRLDHEDLSRQANAVIAALSPTEAKIKSVILADLATAALKGGDYGRAAALGTEALEATLAQEAVLGADRLRAMQRMITRGRDRELDALHESIAASL